MTCYSLFCDSGKRLDIVVGCITLQVFIEERPAAASAHVAQDGEALARFFAGQPRRTELWFGHFGQASSGSGFRFGAGALARYAMLHRGEARLSAAPAAVPHCRRCRAQVKDVHSSCSKP